MTTLDTDRCPRCGTKWQQAYSYRLRRLALGLVLALTLGALSGVALARLGSLPIAAAGVLCGAGLVSVQRWIAGSYTERARR